MPINASNNTGPVNIGGYPSSFGSISYGQPASYLLTSSRAVSTLLSLYIFMHFLSSSETLTFHINFFPDFEVRSSIIKPK